MCGLARADQLLQHILELLTQEYGDDRRRSLVRSESVVIARVCRRLSQQVRMQVHRP